MKKILLLMLSFVALALTSCKEEVVDPKISLTAGEVTETTISFTVTPADAEKCAYKVVLATEELPTDAVVLAQGVQIEAKAESKQTVSDLQPGTEYVVVVAVQNGPKQKSATLEMTTVEPQIPAATVSVTAGEATENTISFTIESADATAVAYVVSESAIELSAEEVLEEGIAVEVGAVEVTIDELTAETEYYIVAAATNGEEAVLSEVVTIETLAGQTPPPPPTNDAVILGRSYGDTNYGIYVFENGEQVMYIDAFCPTSTFSILPEATYEVNGEGDYYIGQWSEGKNWAKLSSGSMVVKHLDSGYEIVIDIVDENGEQYSYSYSGYVQPYDEYASFNNPPIPWNDETVNFTVEGGVTGDHYAPGKEFSVRFATVEGYEFYISLYSDEVVYDGILPEGTYTYYSEDAQGKSIASWSYVNDGTRDIDFVDGSTVTVSHLAEGFSLEFNIENFLKTKFVGSWSGVIGSSEYANQEFRNPGIALTADYTAVMTKGERGSSYQGGTYYIFSNDEGAELKILVNSDKTNPVLEAGVYGAVWGFDDDEYVYVFNGNESTIKYPGVTDGMSWPLYASGGYFDVKVDANGLYTIDANMYAYTSSNQLFNFTYEGDLEGLNPDTPPTPPTESNCVIKGRYYSDTNFEVYVYDEANTQLLYLDTYVKSSVAKVLPEGEYFVDNEANYYTPSQYPCYIGQYSKVTSPAEVALQSGSMVVTHLEEGYSISINVVDNNGTSYVYNWSGIMEGNDGYAIGNPPIPYNDITVNTSVESIYGEHSGPSNQFTLNVTTADGEYEMNLQLQSPETVANGIMPEGTYTIGGSDYLLQSYCSMNGNKLVEGSSVTVYHLSEGYEVIIAVEDVYKTKVNTSFSGLIFKSENASYPFENPGYTYPPHWDLTINTYVGEYEGSDWSGATYKGYEFTNDAGDKMKLGFHTEAFVDGVISEGVYTLGDWNNFGPTNYFGNGCEFWIAENNQSYAMYPTSGTITVSKMVKTTISLLQFMYTAVDTNYFVLHIPVT